MKNDSASAAQQNLRAQAAAAFKKQQQKQPLTAKEKRALQRWDDEQKEALRHEHYLITPKKDFCALAGRQHKLVDDLHRNYGAPVDGSDVNLYKFVKWVFDFLSQNGRKLNKPEDGDDLLSGPETPELEKLRRVNRELKEIDLAERRTQVLDRSKVRDGLNRVAAKIRDCGDALQRRFGPDALDLLLQHLDAVEGEIIALCHTKENAHDQDDSRP